jgi:hypothetical protein
MSRLKNCISTRYNQCSCNMHITVFDQLFRAQGHEARVLTACVPTKQHMHIWGLSGKNKEPEEARISQTWAVSLTDNLSFPHQIWRKPNTNIKW